MYMRCIVAHISEGNERSAAELWETFNSRALNLPAPPPPLKRAGGSKQKENSLQIALKESNFNLWKDTTQIKWLKGYIEGLKGLLWRIERFILLKNQRVYYKGLKDLYYWRIKGFIMKDWRVNYKGLKDLLWRIEAFIMKDQKVYIEGLKCLYWRIKGFIIKD